jgi:hypothetical protein
MNQGNTCNSCSSLARAPNRPDVPGHLEKHLDDAASDVLYHCSYCGHIWTWLSSGWMGATTQMPSASYLASDPGNSQPFFQLCITSS